VFRQPKRRQAKLAAVSPAGCRPGAVQIKNDEVHRNFWRHRIHNIQQRLSEGLVPEVLGISIPYPRKGQSQASDFKIFPK
jgi:hypothetical protein